MSRAAWGSIASTFEELWQTRALLMSLVARDLRTRYAGSSGGLLWAVLAPLLQLLILTTVFSYVLKVRFGDDGRASFAVALAWGMFPWIAVQEGAVRSTSALLEGSVMVKRMAFPPALLLVQPVFSALVHEIVALGLLLLVMPLLGVSPTSGSLWILVPLAAQAAFAVGIGWILGVSNVYFRDTAHVVGPLLQAWFYLTPIVYPLEAAPAALKGVLGLNPLSGIVEGFRSFAMVGSLSDVGRWSLLWSGCAGLGVLLLGALVVAKARDEIADLV